MATSLLSQPSWGTPLVDVLQRHDSSRGPNESWAWKGDDKSSAQGWQNCCSEVLFVACRVIKLKSVLPFFAEGICCKVKIPCGFSLCKRVCLRESGGNCGSFFFLPAATVGVANSGKGCCKNAQMERCTMHCCSSRLAASEVELSSCHLLTSSHANF